MRETLITAAGSRSEHDGRLELGTVVEGYRERSRARRVRQQQSAVAGAAVTQERRSA